MAILLWQIQKRAVPLTSRSKKTNKGNPLLFGAGAEFLQASDLPMYSNGVLKFDSLGDKPRVIGHIIGGIMSTLPNTMTQADSTASPYMFRVVLEPVK